MKNMPQCTEMFKDKQRHVGKNNKYCSRTVSVRGSPILFRGLSDVMDLRRPNLGHWNSQPPCAPRVVQKPCIKWTLRTMQTGAIKGPLQDINTLFTSRVPEFQEGLRLKSHKSRGMRTQSQCQIIMDFKI